MNLHQSLVNFFGSNYGVITSCTLGCFSRFTYYHYKYITSASLFLLVIFSATTSGVVIKLIRSNDIKSMISIGIFGLSSLDIMRRVSNRVNDIKSVLNLTTNKPLSIDLISNLILSNFDKINDSVIKLYPKIIEKLTLYHNDHIGKFKKFTIKNDDVVLLTIETSVNRNLDDYDKLYYDELFADIRDPGFIFIHG